MSAPLPRFVAFGEALTDLLREPDGVRWAARPGGSPWNVARVVARLGVPAAFAGAVDQEVFGDAIAAASADAGLDARFLQRVPHAPLLAVVPETAPPRYFFVGDDAADLHFDPAALPAGWMQAAAAVSFGSISLARAPLAGRLLDVASRCRAAGRWIAYDPNHRVGRGFDWSAAFEPMVRLADLVRCSDDDLAQLMPGATPDAAIARLRSWNPRASILFTRGAAGLRLYAPEGTLDQPALSVAVADTVGAGDASLGGFVWSRLTRPEAPAATHLRTAAATAAAACRVPGAHAPTRDEVEALLV